METKTSTLRTLLIVRAILLVAFGLIVLFYPGMTVLGLVYYFGILAIISGILAFIHIFTEKNWLYIFPALFEIFLGILVMTYPGVTAAVVTWLFVIWLIALGFVIFINGLAGVTVLKGAARVLMIIAGALLAILAIGLMLQPILIAGLNVLYFIGIFSVASGIFLFLTGIFTKKETLKEAAKEAEKE